MTVMLNGKLQIVLRTSDRENLQLKRGDVLVVVRNTAGCFVLQKRRKQKSKTGRTRSYLTPRPISSGVLERHYGTANPQWDTVEAEAVAAGRRSLAGRSLDDL